MKNLFDITHQDALNPIQIREVHEFLFAQRALERTGCTRSVDTVLVAKEMRTARWFGWERKRR